MISIIVKIIFIFLMCVGLTQNLIQPSLFFFWIGIFTFHLTLVLSILKQTRLWFWLPILLIFLGIRIALIPPSPLPPEVWKENLKENNLSNKKQGANRSEKKLKYYVRIDIESVIKPGTYLTKVELNQAYQKDKLVYERVNKKQNLNAEKKDLTFRNIIQYNQIKSSSKIGVYFKGDDNYLASGCRIWMKLEKMSLPRRIPNNSFGEYLRSNQMESIVYFRRKNFYKRNCRHLDMRGRFQNTLSTILSKAKFNFYEKGVAFGLILGRASYIDPDLKDKAKKLGILHLFAASGMHLALVYVWFFWPLSYFKGKKNKFTLVLPLVPCFIYMYILAFPISLLRSFIFICIGALQNIVHRKINSTHLLLNSAIIVAYLNPKDFLSAGCILSFSAVMGIFYFYKPLLKEFQRLRLPLLNPLWQNICMSVSAGIFTLPFIIVWFGGYSYSSLVANAVLVPLSGLIMPLLVGGLSLGLLSDGHFMFFAELSRIATSFFIFLTEYFSRFDFYRNYNYFFCPPILINFLLVWASLMANHFYKSKYRIEPLQGILILIQFLSLCFLSPLATLF